MSKTKLVKQCQGEVQLHLESLTRLCVAELRAIMKSKQPVRTFLLMFVYDSMQFGREFPVMLWWLDRTGMEFKNKRLLRSAKFTVPEEMLRRYELEEIVPDPHRITGRAFIEWFTDCWEQAGGGRFAFPAYLKHHDDTTSYDLKRCSKVEFPEPRFPDE